MTYVFDWSVLWKYRDLLVAGLANTLILFSAAVLAAIAAGIVVGICGASRKRILRIFAECYVEFCRNVPLVVKIFFLYFGLGLEEFQSAIIGLSLHQSAYIGEVIRSGIQAIPSGQTEAGLSSGMTRLQVMRKIVLPQSFIVILPPMTTQIAELLKNTPIAMTISIQELTFQIQQIESNSFRGFEAATAATLMYLLLILVVAALANTLENHLRARRFWGGAKIIQVPVATGAG